MSFELERFLIPNISPDGSIVGETKELAQLDGSTFASALRMERRCVGGESFMRLLISLWRFIVHAISLSSFEEKLWPTFDLFSLSPLTQLIDDGRQWRSG